MATEKRKVLIIGIDGGTWRVLTPAIEKGHMPNLKKLVREGTSGILRSTLPAITPAAWSSFQTGMNPGKTGVFDFRGWDRNKREYVMASSLRLENTMWDLASRSGKRVGLLNVPMTFPPWKVNGYMVSGLMTPDLDSDMSYPIEFKKELLEAVPDYEIHRSGEAKDIHLSDRGYDYLLDEMCRLIEDRAKAARFMIGKEKLDLFMVHFVASDKIQHSMWGYITPGHHLFEEKKRKEILSKFYSKLDEKIGEVRGAFEKSSGPDFLTLLVSDHGFQTHLKRFNLARWLCDQGYMKSKIVEERKKPLWKRIVIKLDFLKLRESKVANKVITKKDKIDWTESRAFSIGQSNEGFVYVLDEGRAKKALVNEIGKKLCHVKDPETGKKIVDAGYRKEDVYSGKYMDILPDIVIDPSPGYSCTGNLKPGTPLFHKVNLKDDYHIGKHHRNGILIAHGPAVKNGKKIEADIMDVAPTVLAYLGVRPPPEIDGTVLTSIFNKGTLDMDKGGHREENILAMREKERIRKKIKGMKNV